MGGAKMAATQDGTLQIWDLWIPDVAAVGVSFARGRLAVTDTLLVHAAPQKLIVEVMDERGVRVARGQDLPRTSDTRMARPRRGGDTVTPDDTWPSATDAKASLTSIRSMASCERPALARTAFVAGIGPVSMLTGSTPTTFCATMRARGRSPSSAAFSGVVSSTAAAPSLI